MVGMIHKAGEAKDSVQRCQRCDVILADNRGVQIPDDDPRGPMYFGVGTFIERGGSWTAVVGVEPNCKPREQILAETRRLRDELRLDFNTTNHWNRTHPEQTPIPHDPQLLVVLAQYDAILADEADRNIGPTRPAVTTEAVH